MAVVLISKRQFGTGKLLLAGWADRDTNACTSGFFTTMKLMRKNRDCNKTAMIKGWPSDRVGRYADFDSIFLFFLFFLFYYSTGKYSALWFKTSVLDYTFQNDFGQTKKNAWLPGRVAKCLLFTMQHKMAAKLSTPWPQYSWWVLICHLENRVNMKWCGSGHC